MSDSNSRFIKLKAYNGRNEYDLTIPVNQEPLIRRCRGLLDGIAGTGLGVEGRTPTIVARRRVQCLLEHPAADADTVAVAAATADPDQGRSGRYAVAARQRVHSHIAQVVRYRDKLEREQNMSRVGAARMALREHWPKISG